MQKLTRRQVSAERRRLARKLERSHGMRVADTWGPLGFMSNRAPWWMVKAAVESSIDDPDPIAAALELLAEASHA